MDGHDQHGATGSSSRVPTFLKCQRGYKNSDHGFCALAYGRRQKQNKNISIFQFYFDFQKTIPLVCGPKTRWRTESRWMLWHQIKSVPPCVPGWFSMGWSAPRPEAAAQFGKRMDSKTKTVVNQNTIKYQWWTLFETRWCRKWDGIDVGCMKWTYGSSGTCWITSGAVGWRGWKHMLLVLIAWNRTVKIGNDDTIPSFFIFVDQTKHNSIILKEFV